MQFMDERKGTVNKLRKSTPGLWINMGYPNLRVDNYSF